MHKYISKHILMMILAVVDISLLVFTILKMTPGDLACVVAGSEADEVTVTQIREELGLNKPVLQQHVNYMADVLHDDMGNSCTTGKPVLSETLSRMSTTSVLAFAGVLVTVLIGIPLGIISATEQYSILDDINILLALTDAAMPNSQLGLMLILMFALQFSWLSSGGVASRQDYILPAVTLGMGAAVNFICTTCPSMLEVIRQDYIYTVRVEGASEKRAILCHALHNALILAITVIGLQIGALLGDAVVNETVFPLPGVGMLMTSFINKEDEPVVLGCLIAFVIVFSLVNLFVDTPYAYIDLRIKS